MATAATAQRNFDDFLTADDPEDGGGSVELTITPYLWSGPQGGTSGIMYLSGSGNPALWVEGGTYRARIDGTTNLDSGVQPVDTQVDILCHRQPCPNQRLHLFRRQYRHTPLLL